MPLPLALPPADPGFEILISSQGMSQGLAQTEGIQLFPRAFVRLGNAQAGVQWRNIDSPTANGVAALFAKYGRAIGKGQVDLAVRYRIRTGQRGPGNHTAWEFSGSGRRSFGNVSVQASLEYSADEFGRGKSLYAEVVPALKLDRFRISAGLGRRYRERDSDYTSVNLGLSRSVGEHVTLDARYFATDRGDLGERYKRRLIVSARVTL